jgi:hypothetical protein
LAALGALLSSAAKATLTALAALAKTHTHAHTSTPLVFMTLLFAARQNGIQRV